MTELVLGFVLVAMPLSNNNEFVRNQAGGQLDRASKFAGHRMIPAGSQISDDFAARVCSSRGRVRTAHHTRCFYEFYIAVKTDDRCRMTAVAVVSLHQQGVMIDLTPVNYDIWTGT